MSRGWTGDLQRSLPTPTSLKFCDCLGLPRSLGHPAGQEVLVPYVESQHEGEEMAQAAQDEVEAQLPPIAIEKSHVG